MDSEDQQRLIDELLEESSAQERQAHLVLAVLFGALGVWLFGLGLTSAEGLELGLCSGGLLAAAVVALLGDRVGNLRRVIGGATVLAGLAWGGVVTTESLGFRMTPWWVPYFGLAAILTTLHVDADMRGLVVDAKNLAHLKYKYKSP